LTGEVVLHTLQIDHHTHSVIFTPAFPLQSRITSMGVGRVGQGAKPPLDFENIGKKDYFLNSE